MLVAPKYSSPAHVLQAPMEAGLSAVVGAWDFMSSAHLPGGRSGGAGCLRGCDMCRREYYGGQEGKNT